jgi:hypothetical protein
MGIVVGSKLVLRFKRYVHDSTKRMHQDPYIPQPKELQGQSESTQNELVDKIGKEAHDIELEMEEDIVCSSI